VSEWFTHTPPDILAENFGVPAETFKNIPLRDLYIFQGELPGDLAADRQAVSGKGAPPHPFTFSLASGAPARETRGGTVQVIQSERETSMNWGALNTSRTCKSVSPVFLIYARRRRWLPSSST
jgi:oxalate decarboxylase